MTRSNFQPDDPRLTAYALGELDLSERTQVETLLAESADARAALEGIRETIALLRSELTYQPALKLTSSQRETVTQAVVAIDTGEPTRAAGKIPASETRATVTAADSGKMSRWVVVGRVVTAVAAVAVVAVAVPWVFHRLQNGASIPSAADSLVSSAKSVGDESMRREESSQSSGSTEFVLTDDASLMNRESRADEVMTVNRVESYAETADSFANEDEAGKPVSTASPATLFFSDGRQPSPAVSTSPSMKGDSLGDRGATQASQAGDAAESTSGGLMFGDLGGENRLLAQNSAAEGKNESRVMSREAATVVDSIIANDSKELSLSATAGRELSEALEFEPESEARTSYLSIAAGGMPAGGGLGGRGLGLGRSDGADFGLGDRRGESEQLGESIELSKSQFGRFRNLRGAAPGSEAYDAIIENVFVTPIDQPLSTFSIDVDTASYANTRRFIQQGQLPPANAVRIEELVNYFRYDYPEPTDGSPFSVSVDVATCPWKPQHKLARVGLKARTIAEDKRPATNLVFLIDVSGSMAAENKLPLVKQALSVLVSRMGEDDQIAIVTYAGEAGLRLNSTSGSQRNAIQQAIDSLSSGGSTNGAAGIQIAYDTAIHSFIRGGANRVILCTDGDFNVGVSDDNTLVEIIQEKAASGVFLSVFGFGMGNLKDAKLEKLADKGNGNYGYIDGLQEARKVFGEQLSGTLITVAKDVKLQLEFNNSTVGAYRLIGYENRVLAARDFDDDTKDAGEIGAGHTVTALYEIVPKAVWLTHVGLNPEKFDIVEKNIEHKENVDDRLFTVKLRHKLPDAETSERSMDYAAMNSDVQLSDSHVDFRFAAAVASFGMQIRESEFRGQWTLQNVLSMAEASLSADRNGERTEFTDLVRGVMRIKGESVPDPRLTLHPTVANPADLPAELAASDARIKATVDGKYRRLLKKIEVRSDVATYGDFRDFGHWDGTTYSGHSDLPAGYWVWVYPNWYIWGDVVESPGSEPAVEQPKP